MTTSTIRTQSYDHDASARSWRRMQNAALIGGWALTGTGVMVLAATPASWQWKLLVGTFLIGIGLAYYIASLIVGGQARILEGQAELVRELRQNRPATRTGQSKEF